MRIKSLLALCAMLMILSGCVYDKDEVDDNVVSLEDLESINNIYEETGS